MVCPTMVTLNEASAQSGLSYDYLRKLCLQKKIVYVRAGCKYLVNLEKLVEYLNRGEKETHDGSGGIAVHTGRGQGVEMDAGAVRARQQPFGVCGCF